MMCEVCWGKATTAEFVTDGWVNLCEQHSEGK
jgi:hypothetical protein